MVGNVQQWSTERIISLKKNLLLLVKKYPDDEALANLVKMSCKRIKVVLHYDMTKRSISCNGVDLLYI